MGGGRDFPHPSRPALGPSQPPVQRVPATFPGVKRPARGVDNTPPTSAEVKERVKLHFRTPSVHSRPLPSTYRHYQKLRKACGKGKEREPKAHIKTPSVIQHYKDRCGRLCVKWEAVQFGLAVTELCIIQTANLTTVVTRRRKKKCKNDQSAVDKEF